MQVTLLQFRTKLHKQGNKGMQKQAKLKKQWQHTNDETMPVKPEKHEKPLVSNKSSLPPKAVKKRKKKKKARSQSVNRVLKKQARQHTTYDLTTTAGGGGQHTAAL